MYGDVVGIEGSSLLNDIVAGDDATDGGADEQADLQCGRAGGNGDASPALYLRTVAVGVEPSVV